MAPDITVSQSVNPIAPAASLQRAGWLLIIGAVLVMIPYTALTMTFDYPDILRLSPGEVLTRFRAGGVGLIVAWWIFALSGLPLLGAMVRLGQRLEPYDPAIRVATVIGVIGGIVQVVGLLRWPLVVPVLADLYGSATNDSMRTTATALFQVIHQYGGVVLGEHLGQLFSIYWTLSLTRSLQRLGLLPWVLIYGGYLASALYLLAQTELIATVIPTFPVVGWAGLVGSSLWLLWLVGLGVVLLRNRTFSQLLHD